MKYCLLICLFASVQLHAQNKARAKVGAAVARLQTLLIDPDSAKLADMVSDHLSYGHSSGLVENKTAFVTALASGRARFLRIETADQTIEVAGNIALVRHRLEGAINDTGKAAPVKLHVLTVWQRHRGKWLLLARQATRLP